MTILVLEFSNVGYKIRKIMRLPVSPILKIKKIPLGMLIIRQQIFLILYHPFENLTTCIVKLCVQTDPHLICILKSDYEGVT